MSSLGLTDDEFLATFERAGFTAHDFPHRAHLRMAYLYVQRLGPEAAAESACAGIRHLASAHGHFPKYHDTLTRAWVQVVTLAMAQHPDASFGELLDAHPRLLDTGLLLAHYSREALFSAQARAGWVEPDHRPIAAVAG